MEVNVEEEALRELGKPWLNLTISFKRFSGIKTFEHGGNVKSTIEHNFDFRSDAWEGEDEIRKGVGLLGDD